MYVTNTSATAIAGLDTPTISSNNIAFYADGGGEGTVIFDSAVALSQGMFPATSASNTVLANGTTVTSPLGGYQYIGIDALLPTNDIRLEGWTDCNVRLDNTSLWNGAYATLDRLLWLLITHCTTLPLLKKWRRKMLLFSKALRPLSVDEALLLQTCTTSLIT